MITKTIEIQLKAVHSVEATTQRVLWKSDCLRRSVNPLLRIETRVDSSFPGSSPVRWAASIHPQRCIEPSVFCLSRVSEAKR